MEWWPPTDDIKECWLVKEICEGSITVNKFYLFIFLKYINTVKCIIIEVINNISISTNEYIIDKYIKYISSIGDIEHFFSTIKIELQIIYVLVANIFNLKHLILKLIVNTKCQVNYARILWRILTVE